MNGHQDNNKIKHADKPMLFHLFMITVVLRLKKKLNIKSKANFKITSSKTYGIAFVILWFSVHYFTVILFFLIKTSIFRPR